MSRIGKKPILMPKGVEVKISEGKISVKGPKGEIIKELPGNFDIKAENNEIIVSPKEKSGLDKKTKAIWGLTRAVLSNAVIGVSNGFERNLEIEGVGYKASVEGKDLVLEVGFTNPIKIEAPYGITFSVKRNVITVSGADKELVGQIAAKIKKVKPPEPYKGKGIKYQGEVIRRKLGKKVVGAGG